MNLKQKLESNLYGSGIKLSKTGLKMIQFQAMDSEDGADYSYSELLQIDDMLLDLQNSINESRVCVENMKREMRGEPLKPVQPQKVERTLPHILAVK